MTHKMKNIAKAILMLALIFALLLSLGACSSGGGSGSSRNESASMDSAAPAPAPSAPASSPDRNRYDGEGGMDVAEEWYDDMGAEADLGYSGTAPDLQKGRKITFSASLSINTKTFDADYAKINKLIVQTGGYVSSENTTDNSAYGRNQGRQSVFSARIPAEGFDSFLDRLSEVGDVTNKSKSSDDLTSQYFDTEARIEMLELRKERLMAYLVEAENASDIVEFERELADVLYDLDAYQGNKRHLDRLVDFATVDVYLYELITPETIGKDGEPLGERASEAFALSADGVNRFLQGVVVFFAGAAPVLALLVIIAVIIWAIVRATRPLREKMRNAREEREKRKPARQKQQSYTESYWRQGYPQQGYPQQPYQQMQGYPQQPNPQAPPVAPPAPGEAPAQMHQAKADAKQAKADAKQAKADAKKAKAQQAYMGAAPVVDAKPAEASEAPVADAKSAEASEAPVADAKPAEASEAPVADAKPAEISDAPVADAKPAEISDAPDTSDTPEDDKK